VELVTHKTLHFPHSRAAVWSAMAEVASYKQWWPWLRAFDAHALVTGDEWRCTVRAPIPYTVSFTIAFDDVLAEHHARANVRGDIVGNADLTLSDTPGGCEVVVRSDLAPRATFLRFLATTFPPVARYGHDWILSTGAQQFEARALSAGARGTTT
jgi:hypothetical protein